VADPGGRAAIGDGFLRSTSLADATHLVVAFREGLKETGYVEGQNVAIEYRWADGHLDRLPALVADLVRQEVALIVGNTPSALAAKAATTTVPIVFVTGGDPVIDGFAVGLNRPGGNTTGVSFLTSAVVTKRLELLRQLVPKAAAIGVLVNLNTPQAERERRDVGAAAHAIGQELIVVEADSDRDIEAAFATFAQRGAGALFVGVGGFLLSRRERLVALAARHRISRDLCLARIRRGRRPDELRDEHHRCIPPGWHLRWPHSQRREAGRLAGPTVHEV
jgi:ABC-type uncharacterized transport system substrate-binding protein